jgi:hypothetical protein
MIEIVGVGGMDIRQGEVIFARDLIDATAQPFMPNGDVLNLDATPGNPRFAARHARRSFKVLVDRLDCHDESSDARTLLSDSTMPDGAECSRPDGSSANW